MGTRIRHRFILGEHQGCTLWGLPRGLRPAQGQRSPTARFPSQRFQSGSHQRCSTLINPQALRQRDAGLSATAQRGGCRAGALPPAWELSSKNLKGARLLAAACCCQLARHLPTPLHRAVQPQEVGQQGWVVRRPFLILLFPKGISSGFPGSDSGLKAG